MRCKVLKKMVAGVSMAAIALSLMACGGSSDNTAVTTDEKVTEGSSSTTSIEGLVTDGKLTFVVDDSVVPCAYRDDDNQLIGFEIDCGNAIGEYLGLDVEWTTNAWENLITTVQTGKADGVIDGLYVTDERKEVVDFCDSYYSMDEVIVCKKGNDEIQKPEDLIGKKVGVQPASADLEDVKKLGVEDISEYSRIPDGIMDISNGRIDAFVTESLCAAYYGKGDNYDIRLDNPLGSAEIGIATNKNTPEVTKAINEAIAALKADGTLSEISEKWFDADIITK